MGYRFEYYYWFLFSTLLLNLYHIVSYIIKNNKIYGFTSKDPEFVSNQPKYLIINNAVGYEVKEESEFIVKSVIVYK